MFLARRPAETQGDHPWLKRPRDEKMSQNLKPLLGSSALEAQAAAPGIVPPKSQKCHEVPGPPHAP